jgi:hypothetical protein
MKSGRRKRAAPSSQLDKTAVLRCFDCGDLEQSLNALGALLAASGGERGHEVLLSKELVTSVGTDVYWAMHSAGFLDFATLLQSPACSIHKVAADLLALRGGLLTCAPTRASLASADVTLAASVFAAIVQVSHQYNTEQYRVTAFTHARIYSHIPLYLLACIIAHNSTLTHRNDCTYVRSRPPAHRDYLNWLPEGRVYTSR